MSTGKGSMRGRLILLAVASTSVVTALAVAGANRLFLERRPEGLAGNFVLNEAVLLAALLVFQAVLWGWLLRRWFRPLEEIAGLLRNEASVAPGSAGAPEGLGEITRVYASGLALLRRHEAGIRALEELERVRSDSGKLAECMRATDRTALSQFRPSSQILPPLTAELGRHLGDEGEYREENAAVVSQIQTEGREAVLAAREASSLAETCYLETTELGVALRDLSRVIGEVRPILEIEAQPSTAPETQIPGLAQACSLLAEIADRHRTFALRTSRGWATAQGPPPEDALPLLQDIQDHLEWVELRRSQAERALAQVPPETGDLSARARAALKKLLQSAEESGERLVRLTSAAERASNAARRANALSERELQSLEALGIRLEGEVGPSGPAETLGESDFVVEPES